MKEVEKYENNCMIITKTLNDIFYAAQPQYKLKKYEDKMMDMLFLSSPFTCFNYDI